VTLVASFASGDYTAHSQRSKNGGRLWGAAGWETFSLAAVPSLFGGLDSVNEPICKLPFFSRLEVTSFVCFVGVAEGSNHFIPD
jgi:hypothetical protein